MYGRTEGVCRLARSNQIYLRSIVLVSRQSMDFSTPLPRPATCVQQREGVDSSVSGGGFTMKIRSLILVLALSGGTAAAQQMDVDFQILEDAQAAGCAGSIVSGLNPNGDGFLAVRTGPGTNYRKIDELHNGDTVRTCAQKGSWFGVYYGQPRRKGWVHGKWLVAGAG